MELGNIVWFSSNSRPFLVNASYCNNPDCLCNEVFLTFHEISDSGEQLPHAMAFRVRVDLETWQENDPPQRSAEVAAWVREFLAKCPDSRRAEFKAAYKEAKRVAKRIAEYKIEPDDVLEGRLVSFPDILTEGGSLSEGGVGYTYHFPHEGREYLVVDRYCPNPDCDCQIIHIEFFESVSQQVDKPIFQRFLGKLTFDGRVQVVERGGCSLPEAKRVLSAWWKQHRDDLQMLRDRYQEVKDIGQRNLDATPNYPARTRELFANSQILEELPDEMIAEGPPERIRVGRNAPCPCGSGKKYKKCCWRRDNQIACGRDTNGTLNMEDMAK